MFLDRNVISIHSLVRGRTAVCTKYERPKRYFNPLPRERENGKAEALGVNIDYFNPLPRERENRQLIIV